MAAFGPPIQRLSQLALFAFGFSLVGWINSLVNNAHRNGSSGYDVSVLTFLLTSLTSGFLFYSTWKGKGAIKSCALRAVIISTYILVICTFIFRAAEGARIGNRTVAAFGIIFALLWAFLTIFTWRLMKSILAEEQSPNISANPARGQVNSVEVPNNGDIV